MSAINQMMRAANPVPDPATALADDDFEALLLVSQTRRGKMDAKETMRPVEPEAPRRRGWLIAAVSFAAVVVVVGAAALLMRPTGGAAPATTPPTTEAAAPITTAAAVITGVWRTPDGFYIVMADDGTYRGMTKPPGEERSDEFEWGTYTVTGSTLVFTVAEDAVLFTKCKERDDDGEWVGIVGTYQIEAIGDDGQTWTTVLVDDACADRARDYTGQFTKHAS
jgi:hypothetical protein